MVVFLYLEEGCGFEGCLSLLIDMFSRLCFCWWCVYLLVMCVWFFCLVSKVFTTWPSFDENGFNMLDSKPQL